MAFGRLERNPGARPMSDINMTPLIDVMLVLLVIFMITAPLMTSSLRLDLPRADGAAPSDAPAFVALAIDAQGGLFLADQPAAVPRGATRPPRCNCVPTAACPTAAWPRSSAGCSRPGSRASASSPSPRPGPEPPPAAGVAS